MSDSPWANGAVPSNTQLGLAEPQQTDAAALAVAAGRKHASSTIITGLVGTAIGLVVLVGSFLLAAAGKIDQFYIPWIVFIGPVILIKGLIDHRR